MYTHFNIALYALYALLVLNLVFALMVYAIKLRNVGNRIMYERFYEKYRDYLVYIQANLESDERLRVPPARMNRIERNAMQEKINDMIESFAGEQRDKLIDLCNQMGFIQFHLQRLNGRSYRRKIDAAYHLGCMRVKEVVPAMLALLRNHKYDSSLFVIARAVAKCARSEKDVKDMVQIMLAQGKSFPDLIADMIEEARIDHTALYTEFLQEDRAELIHIGLIGLKEHTNPMIAAAVYRLMDSSNEEIQRKAIQIYLKSSVFLPRNVVSKLLGHPDAEIRLMTIQALSEYKNPVYAGVMHPSLQDPDPRVVHAAAIGLINQGQEGISIFCEAARNVRDQGRGTHLQDIIEEELNLLSARIHDLDNLTRYNALMYTYEKTFGKNKQIYRVV